MVYRMESLICESSRGDCLLGDLETGRFRTGTIENY